jgi:starch synthase
MEIVMVSSEALPFAKTGGLADVCGALPMRLANMGHRCSLFMPGYASALQSGHPIEDTHLGFVLDMAGKRMAVRILKSTFADGALDYYFIDQPHYFQRSHLYGDEHQAYSDNCERFAFFCRAVVEAIERLRIPAEIVHCHDWQAGLVPAYIKTRFGNHSWYDRAKVVMTIHNLAYQGRFWVHDMPLTALDWQYFNADQLEFWGDLCFLKAGIIFADWVTTVSPTYAKEIQLPAFGCAMDGVLRNLGDRLSGIVNGVDYQAWDPKHDNRIPMSYGLENWKSGKAAAKVDLQRELGLPVDESKPVIGLIGRMAEQKGWHLVIPLMKSWTPSRDVQWMILGNGDAGLQNAVSELAHQYPDKVAVRVEFSDRLAHRIEAAADIFLMPSMYEPCGLNQLYSLRYGTIPIVHAVGGLVDTVTHATPVTLANQTATGFAFYHYDTDSLSRCLEQAVDYYIREPEGWRKMVETGMQQDWSWGKSAQAYVAIYEKLQRASENR